jgi:thiol-disulfide isomerase/thioredoxin
MIKYHLKTLLVLAWLILLPCSLLAAQDGQRLIPFKGHDLNGQPFDLQQSIGSKPVMLIFWASWCPSCKTEVPKVNQLAAKFKDRGMEFIAVNVGFNDSVERAQVFVKKTGMSYPTFFDAKGKVTEQYQLQGVPTVIIADKQGVIQFRNYATPDISEAIFTQLMAN